MNCNETVKCRKVRRGLIYHGPNKDKYPDKFAHHLLFMFYQFRSEDESLTGNTPTYRNTLACSSILNAISKNRQKFGPYADIVEEAFVNLNHNLQSNQNPYGQIENDETKDTSFSDKKENASNVNTNEDSSEPFYVLSNQLDESLAANIRSLNAKQRHVFNFAHKWA